MSEEPSGILAVCAAAVFAFLIATPTASAQVAAGEITGIIQDQNRGAVPGATVTVTNIATNLQRVVASSGDGVYTAASLTPGAYRIEVAISGFKPVRREGVRLSTGEKARIDFDLTIGDIREKVAVVGAAATCTHA